MKTNHYTFLFPLSKVRKKMPKDSQKIWIIKQEKNMFSWNAPLKTFSFLTVEIYKEKLI